MIILIVGIYVFIGVISAFSNLGKWVFGSFLWAIPLLPFMIIYYLIYGDATKRSEAKSLIKLLLFLAGLYCMLYLIILAIQT
jgi:hypothetical protein